MREREEEEGIDREREREGSEGIERETRKGERERERGGRD